MKEFHFTNTACKKCQILCIFYNLIFSRTVYVIDQSLNVSPYKIISKVLARESFNRDGLLLLNVRSQRFRRVANGNSRFILLNNLH